MIAVLLAQVAEEAPSSISTGDQVRAFVILAVCLLAMAIIAALAIRQARRHRRSDGSGPA